MNKDSLKEMTKAIQKIEKERNWRKFHTPKDMAMALMKETAELLEHFIWDTNKAIISDQRRLKKIEEEASDVLRTLLLLSEVTGINLIDGFWNKLEKTRRKYPVSETYGKSGYELKHQKRK